MNNLDCLLQYINSIGSCVLHASSDSIIYNDLLKSDESTDKCRKFCLDPTCPILCLSYHLSSSEDSLDQSNYYYSLQLHVQYTKNIISTVVFVKQSPILDINDNLACQLSFIKLLGGASIPVVPSNQSTTPFYDVMYNYVQHALAPFFTSFLETTSSLQKDPSLDAQSTYSPNAGRSAFTSNTDENTRHHSKSIPIAKKKFADLAVALLHLQQNVEIPHVLLNAHPSIIQSIEDARKQGVRPNVNLLEPELLSSTVFLNRLQADVAVWVKEAQKVTRLSRDPSTGTASQEINFWLNMERALDRLDKQLKSDEVILVLDVLRHAKRFHATVSFHADTGVQAASEQVHKFNILMKEFPINELLSAADMVRITDSIRMIFGHIGKKIKLSSYPIKRYLLLVEAVSRDVQDQMFKVLRARQLMYLPYDEFTRIVNDCMGVFAVWDVCVKDFSTIAREISRRRGEKYLPIKIIPFHAKLQERIEQVIKFRQQHDHLRATICRVTSSSITGTGHVLKSQSFTSPSHNKSLDSSSNSALNEVDSAYEIVRVADVLDVSTEGTEVWMSVEQAYNERVRRVETLIITTLREKLSAAKNASEMFRVFSKFNALFVRPKIRSAIQEYQAQLIESVKEDLSKLQDKFKVQYPSSEAFHMSTRCYDIGPISGAITWARQIERQLDMLHKRVEDVLGQGWENYVDGARLLQDSNAFRKKLDTRPIYEQWITDILDRKLSVSGRVFDVVRHRIVQGNVLQLVVSFDQQIVTLFKEVRNIAWLGYHIPATISNIANDAMQVYPFAVSLQETIRTYQATLDIMKAQPQEAVLLVAGYQKDVQTLIASGIHINWDAFAYTEVGSESHRHVAFVRDLSNHVITLNDKVVMAVDILSQIHSNIQLVNQCAYSFASFEVTLTQIQTHVDVLNLNGFSNLSLVVYQLDRLLESALANRLCGALEMWVQYFLTNQPHAVSPKPGGSSDSQPTKTEPESMLILEPMILEITIFNQIMNTSPPLEQVRTWSYLRLQEWIAVVCNQHRIRASNYHLSMQQMNDQCVYGHLLEQIPESFLLKAYSAIEDKIQLVEQYVNSWLQYQSLWNLEPSNVYDMLGDDLHKWQQLLLDIKRSRAVFDVSIQVKVFGPIVVDFNQVQSKVNAQYDQWQRDCLLKFGNSLGQRMNEFYTCINQARLTLEKFSIETASTNDTITFILYVQDLKRKVVLWASDVEIFSSGQAVLERHRYQFKSEWIYSDQIEGEWSAFNEIISRKDACIQDELLGLQAKIVQQDHVISIKKSTLIAEWEVDKPIKGDTLPNLANNILQMYESKFSRISDEVQQLSRAKEALGLVDLGQNTNTVVAVIEELFDLKSVWSAVTGIWNELSQMCELVWTNVVASKVRSQLDTLLNATKDMPAKLRQYAAFEYAQDTLRSYTKMNSLISELKSEALRERHWTLLFKKLNTSFNLGLSNLSLGIVWNLDLRRNEQTIREVITIAQGELGLEKYINQVKDVWTNYQLILVNYQNKCRLVKGWDDLFNVCAQDLTALQTMRSSPYYRVFEESASLWEDKLSRIQLLFDAWINVQRQWVYLEGVFSGSADIKYLLPTESTRFQNINSEFMAAMKKVYKAPNVLDVLSIPNIQKSMDRLSDLLAKISKALGEYLERERSAFPRFYFVGDEDLLEIIGNANNVDCVQKHFKKMFSGISSVVAVADGSISAIKSKEGELVHLRNSVRVQGERINEWLAALELEMKLTLAITLEECYNNYMQIFLNLDVTGVVLNQWLVKYPLQLVVLAVQIAWTQSVETSLADSNPPSKTLDQVIFVLDILARTVLSDLSFIDRKKCEHLITELVHQRDVVRKLIKNLVIHATDFDWLYYTRFYLDTTQSEQLNRLHVHTANAIFYYGYEYLGIPDKLVQTPLTDRCFLTLTQALDSRLGGSVYGPAGTGKTESVKALGVALGRFVLVFCCDETFDFQAMGRIFVGLCMVGAWGCFDEFNRLEERILSAVSQQVQSIQLGLQKFESQQQVVKSVSTKSSTRIEIELLGRQLLLNANTGIFITMNFGYLGRNNLPDNLKQLFRYMAMTKPDSNLIAQVMLYSQGFHSAEILSSKVVLLFGVCSEQFSNQPHYDFGLRAFKSVLVTAGNLKRLRINSAETSPGASSTPVIEQEILVQSICETVMPKLVMEDMPLLQSLLQDVFPGINYIPVDTSELQNSIRSICKARSLECTGPWMTKIIQLYQIIQIHHGLMVVGESGTGKTVTWQVLLEALQQVEGIEGVSYIIDPKAIPKDKLYGFLDLTTREWTDGLFTHILRKIIDNVRGEAKVKRHWIIFDGDVDPEWVENLNSVLDDNKLLTLPNGERLALPPNVRIIFEVDTLKYATLATVSRCGMVWFSKELVTGKMLFTQYLTTLLNTAIDVSDNVTLHLQDVNALTLQQSVAATLSPYMEDEGLIIRALKYADEELDHIMDFTPTRAISTFFSLINRAIRIMIEYDAQHVDFPLSLSSIESFITKKMIIAIVWAFAGDGKLDARVQLSKYLRGITTIELLTGANINITDYDISLPDCQWVSWLSRVPQIELETHNVPQADIVVPTIDTISQEQMLYTWLAEHKLVLLCGPPGSGKTMSLFSSLRKLPDMEVAGLNFSSSTTPDLILKTLEQYCEYRKTSHGLILCPRTIGKWLVLFCDEINLPAVDTYGTQRVLSLMRQMIEAKGFWRTSDLQWVRLERIQFVGACNPPTDPGRTPLSYRLLRHASLVMVDYPSRTSLIQIYSTFSRALLKVIPMLRGYVDPLTNAMVSFYLDSQQKFTPDMQAHYIYSPRELTRWVRAIYEAICPLEELSLEGLVRVWAHEGLRLFHDRLVTDEEREWTNQHIDKVALQCFPGLNPSALQRPILFSNWLSRFYLPTDRPTLREFIKARLRVFYEEELDVPLVLFNHLLDHVLRIDRVFRQMQGHMLLIGISGAGKTTLSRFVAWMNGFSVFQLKAHKQYNGSDFDEDLRHVLRRAGCKGEKICFILDESNVLDSGFLERMNTLLANAEIPGLFEGDEFIALMNQCKEAAAKEGSLLDSNAELYKWFTHQIMKNLHVVFTMNPPENGLSSRVVTSPALFNRCVLDWFGDWNDEAFYQVGKEFTDVLDLDASKFVSPDTIPIVVRGLELPLSHRDVILNAFVFIHHSVQSVNQQLAKQQGRYNYCTPRHFLDFIQHYICLLNEKKAELADQQRHINVGLEKLEVTVQQVGELRTSLAEKTLELEQMTNLANDKLRRMVAEQQKAEQKKAASQQMSEALDRQNIEIKNRQKVVQEDLALAEPAVIEARNSVSGIKKQQLTELRSMSNPPEAVKLALESVCNLLGYNIDSWKSIQAVIRRDDFIASILNFDTQMMVSTLRERMKREFLSNPNFNFESANRASKACGPLVQWVIAQVTYSDILDQVGPLRQELENLQLSAEETREKAQEANHHVIQLEMSISKYKDEYATLIAETQNLKAELERVKAKVERSASLIASLGSEQERWEVSSKAFEHRNNTLVGDVLLSAAFLGYGGYYDQQNRTRLWNSWRAHLRLSGIMYKPELALIETLCTLDQRVNWYANLLPTGDLCLENAIMIQRHNRYPLLIDPSGQATAFLTRQFSDRKIIVTSFLDGSFLKHVESALRFGNPILIQDVESIDPILNPILNRELRRTGGRILIRLGKQDIDFSPSFMLFLSTRDPSVDFPPDICSRVTFINFTVTKSSLRSQCLNKILSQERPDVDSKRLDLLKLQGEFSFRLLQLEKSLLQALNDSKSNILDDDVVIATLEQLKNESKEIQVKSLETDDVMKEIDTITDMYTPFANACASNFFVLEQLSHINHFYQFSLEFFNDLFHAVLQSPKINATQGYAERLNVMTFELFKELFRRVSRTLVHDDHVMFATLIVQIFLGMESSHIFSTQEYEFMIRGVLPPRNGNVMSLADFQERITLLSKLGSFSSKIGKHAQDETSQWTEFINFQTDNVPECWVANDDPCSTQINRIILAKVFRPDLVTSLVEDLVQIVFGKQFLFSYEINLESIVSAEANCRTPIAFAALPGLDASHRIENLAHNLGIQLISIAMGSSEGSGLAEKAIASAISSGTWVLLKNVHLVQQWLIQLEKQLHTLVPHKSFRLFLTMETSLRIPVNLLRQSRILMFETPPGIKANLLESLTSIKSLSLTSRGPKEKSRLCFLICWLHAILRERLRYIPLGWSKMYEFNDADLECALIIVDKWCEMAANGRSNLSPSKMPWQALRTLLKESVYGGKIDSNCDKNLLHSFVDQLLVPRAYDSYFELIEKQLSVPEGTRVDEFIKWAQGLPDRESPRWLGLPDNAERLLLANRGSRLFSQIQRVKSFETDLDDIKLSKLSSTIQAPKKKTDSAPVSPIALTGIQSLHMLVQKWSKQLPERILPFTSSNAQDPMARFFYREHMAASQLHSQIQKDFHQLMLACDGLTKHTNHLRSLMSALNHGLIPCEWKVYKFPKRWNLQAWLDDLMRRFDQINVLVQVPSLDDCREAIWFGGLFMPEAFMMATRQVFSRRSSLSLEELVLELDLYGEGDNSIGYTLKGLRIEGANWSNGRICLGPTLQTSLDLATLRWVKRDDNGISRNEADHVLIPVYLNEDRLSFLFNVSLPTTESRHILLQNGVAIIAL